jgi:hypothetical protein
MRSKDPDEAVDHSAGAVEDWSGRHPYRRGAQLFNRQWSRRVLGQGAVVLLITDGLERDSIEELDAEMDRLHKSCRRLIWLNPLLRFEGFRPGPRACAPCCPCRRVPSGAQYRIRWRILCLALGATDGRPSPGAILKSLRRWTPGFAVIL